LRPPSGLARALARFARILLALVTPPRVGQTGRDFLEFDILDRVHRLPQAAAKIARCRSISRRATFRRASAPATMRSMCSTSSIFRASISAITSSLIVVTRMRGHQPTLDYVRRRKAEGKGTPEIIRCLTLRD
jgi:hypothetical protein